MQKLYEQKNIKYGFVIICPNCNIGQIKNTINSIKHHYKPEKYVCVLPEDSHPDDVREIGKLSVVTKGNDTITSLINAGMESACKDWNFIVIAGSWVRANLDRKFSYFIEGEKDILFPVVDRQTNFVDGTINGILIHKKAWKEIGPFANDNPLEICKLMWTMEAIEKSHKFKAVLGASVC